MALLISSCADEGASSRASTGALSTSGDSALCTYTPDEWTARCASHLGSTTLCHALSAARTSDQRERAALDLNVASASSLGAQHFVHGARIAWSVDDIARLARAASPLANVLLAVHDANRAYADCIDHAVLADWITTPVCGLPAANAVQGPATSRCVALDSECRRGRFDAAHSCCDEWDLWAGMVCGEDEADETPRRGSDDGESARHAHDGDGQHRDGESEHAGRGREAPAHVHESPNICNGGGACVDADQVPAAARAHGVYTWVEPVRLDSNPPPTPSIWYLDDTRIEVRLDDAPVAIVPASQVGHRTRVAASPAGSLGVVGLDLGTHVPPTTVRSIILPRRIAPNIDLAHGETYEVCAASGAFDGLGSLVGECQGDQRVTCPSAAGAAITCTVDARGYSVVTGAGLSLAWERDPIGPCPTPSCPLALYPDGGAQCVIFGPGQSVCLFQQPDGAVTCNLCPTGGDAGPSDAGPSDAGPSDAGQLILPPNTNVLDPVLAGLFVIFQPVYVQPLCANCSCGRMPHCPQPLGCFETRTCNANFVWGMCEPRDTPEICNGLDDDCDGIVDEGTDALCDDNIGCTFDGCGGARGCLHIPLPARCSFGRTPASCEVLLCNPPLPVSRAAGDRVLPAPNMHTLGNGCNFIERDTSFCAAPAHFNSCSGRRPNMCTPGTLGSDTATGCVDWCHPVERSRPAISGGILGTETSGVFSPFGGGGVLGSIVLVFNDATDPASIPTPAGGFGWAYSNNFGLSWTVCNAFTVMMTPGCGIANVPGVRSGVPRWVGDPVIAADGLGDVVVVSLDTPTRHGALWVAASLSNDHGHSYFRTQQVNGSGCSPGEADQPAVTINTDESPPHIWVAWRFFSGLVGSTFGGCIRGGRLINSARSGPSIEWFDEGHTIDHMSRPDILRGQGGLRVVARTASFAGEGRRERVTVGYSTPEIGLTSCNVDGVSWETVSTDAGSGAWAYPTRITHTDTFQDCVPDAAGTLFRGLREFDLTIDHTTGAYWAVVGLGGARIDVFVSRDDANWEFVHSISSGGASTWLPSIAADAQGRIAVTYYQTVPGGNAQRMVTASAAGSEDISAGWSGPVPLNPSFSPDRACCSNRGGDYYPVFPIPAAVTGFSFFTAWSEQRTSEPPQSTGRFPDRLFTAPIRVAP